MPYVIARVVAVTHRRPGYCRLTLGDRSVAHALTELVGEVSLGDEVVVETAAVELGLGTGGAHVVHLNLTRLRGGTRTPAAARWADAPGSRLAALRYLSAADRDRLVVKSRYLSSQVAVLTEPGTSDDLPLVGVRVLLCSLHSHALAAAAVAHDLGAGFGYSPADASDSGQSGEPLSLRRRVGYVMTDAGALPFALSDLASDLVERDLLALTVSAGQSFGAAVEAVNVVDAVAAAKARGIRRVVLAPGPGHVGTASRYGFSSLDLAGQATLLAKLGASVALCVRASSIDERHRHRGVSHHTLTLAGLLPEAGVVVVPDAPAHFDGELAQRLGAAAPGVALVAAAPADVAASFVRHQLDVSSMGVSLADDQLACACIGAAARWLAQGEAAARSISPSELASAEVAPEAAPEVEQQAESHPAPDADGDADVDVDGAAAGDTQVDGEPSGEPAEPRFRSRFARQALEWTLVVVLTLALSLGLRAVVVGAFYIPSTSMEPTLTEGTRVLMNRLAYLSVSPQRGEVIVFGSPEAVGDYAPAELIKRVVGVAGDTVEGRGGHLYVNGARQVEPHLAEPLSTSDFPPVEVPVEHVFVMGDNRHNSQDSRAFGPVPLDDVRGRAFVRYWPPSNLGGL